MSKIDKAEKSLLELFITHTTMIEHGTVEENVNIARAYRRKFERRLILLRKKAKKSRL
jgi:hypothetical protein